MANFNRLVQTNELEARKWAYDAQTYKKDLEYLENNPTGHHFPSVGDYVGPPYPVTNMPPAPMDQSMEQDHTGEDDSYYWSTGPSSTFTPMATSMMGHSFQQALPGFQPGLSHFHLPPPPMMNMPSTSNPRGHLLQGE